MGTATRRTAALILALAALAASGCGSDDDDDGAGAKRAPASIDVGDARLATNDPAEDVKDKPSAPSGGIVEGEPPAEAPPAAVGSSGRSCTGGDLQPTAANLGQVVSATICLVNVERETRGLRPLRSNGKLTRAAVGHARDQVNRRYFSHTSQNGASFVDRIRRAGYVRGRKRLTLGENIGMGRGSKSTPSAIVQAWMASPPHRANILKGRFRDIGIGIAVGSGGSGPAATYSTAFGTLR